MVLNRHNGGSPLDVPKDGSVLVCWHCGALALVDHGPLGGLVARAPSAQETVELMADDNIAQALLDRQRPGATVLGATMRMRRRIRAR